VIEKCTFCVHRVEKGRLPACVEACPAFALHFGDLDDPNSRVSRVLRSKTAFRLKEELNTRPKVYYVGQPPPEGRAREIEAVRRKR
jgi:molybdopterin-containing oxidoreductase family iron-sulfur binding subunit